MSASMLDTYHEGFREALDDYQKLGLPYTVRTARWLHGRKLVDAAEVTSWGLGYIDCADACLGLVPTIRPEPKAYRGAKELDHGSTV